MSNPPIFTVECRASAAEKLGVLLDEDLWVQLEEATAAAINIECKWFADPNVDLKSANADLSKFLEFSKKLSCYVPDTSIPEIIWSYDLQKYLQHALSLENTQSEVERLLKIFQHSVCAAMAAADALLERAGVAKFRMWGFWVHQISELLRERDLPTAVGKHRLDEQEGSPFVLFIKELQACLPAGFSPPVYNSASLAQRISRSRRDHWSNLAKSDLEI